MVIQIAARPGRGCSGSRGNGSGVVGNQVSSRRGFAIGDGLKSGFDDKCGLWKWERREWVRIANIFLEEGQSEIIDKGDILCCRERTSPRKAFQNARLCPGCLVKAVQ
jgi:hypothetical protein